MQNIVKNIASYGSWKSPITSAFIVEKALKLSEIQIDGSDLYWSELRPQEKGRKVIVKKDSNGDIKDVFSELYNARTRVHEYGGGDYIVNNGQIYFTNFADQFLYKTDSQQNTEVLVELQNCRLADMSVSSNGLYMTAVQENHKNPQNVQNSVVLINLQTKEVITIAEGFDFYSSPKFSPNSNQIVFMCWNFPNMPWDHTELWISYLENNQFTQAQLLYKPNKASVQEPRYAPDGTIFFASDEQGFWNLYKYSFENQNAECVLKKDAEFSKPQWVFGQNSYVFIKNNDNNSYKIACVYTDKGQDHLGYIENGELQEIKLGFTYYNYLKQSSNHLYFLAASPYKGVCLYKMDLKSQQYELIRSQSLNPVVIDSEYISVAEPIEYPSHENNTSHGFYYPPQNKEFQGPDNEKPLLIVKIHGGPTQHTVPILSSEIQYWTSRGFGVLDVNYGGSTGFGKNYHERLYRQWGTVDVKDCENGALFLAKQGKVDENKLIITGGSAGGWTVLSSLTQSNTFKAGCSLYGVSDLIALAEDTHKFESRYLDILVGSYPEEKQRYIDLAPINHSENIKAPLLILQGDQDQIVPPNQSEKMYKALLDNKVPVSYVLFEGEQHGFRQAENIRKSLDNQLYFYSQIFNFTVDEDITPIKIDNL